MKFKIDSEVRKITSPIVLNIGDKEQNYENGSALSDYEFDKRYVIESISAKGDLVYITVAEGQDIPSTEWTKKEVSFF